MKKIKNYNTTTSIWVEKQMLETKWIVKKDGSDYEFESIDDAERFCEDAFGVSSNIVECDQVNLKPAAK